MNRQRSRVFAPQPEAKPAPKRPGPLLPQVGPDPSLPDLSPQARQEAILAMQRTYGNRYVQRYLARRSPDVVQRVRQNYATMHVPAAPIQNEFNGFADRVSTLVHQAYTELTDLTFVNSWADTGGGGRIQHFKDQWNQFLAAGGSAAISNTALLAAAAGYAIETQVTQLMVTGGMPLPFIVQDPQGGTRPDIVATASDGATLGWIDLTSQNEAAAQHILGKIPSWLNRVNVQFVEENYYPTVNFAAMDASQGLGGVPRTRRDRRNQAEAANFISGVDKFKENKMKERIGEMWYVISDRNMNTFKVAVGNISDADARKVLLFAGINRYPGGTTPPKNARKDGKRIWEANK